jgi:hypothetical protein
MPSWKRCVTVPHPRHHLRDSRSFDSLSDQCEARGDIVAAMMCQIGRTLADQAIAETRAELI